jgi:pyrimidine operon attenuation protein/uracil phosphoribosyltransferase
MGTAKQSILNDKEIEKTLDDLAEAVLKAGDDLVLVGIHTGGVFLARRLAKIMGNARGKAPDVGAIDINLYRDDWTRAHKKPKVGKTDLPFSIDDRRIVLVDDVLFTGRTVRAALDALIDFGRPARIELAVLADRGSRELPIRADYVGLTVNAAVDQRVNVYFRELGHRDELTVEAAPEPPS